MSTTIGVLGSNQRSVVTPWGAIDDVGRGRLDWFVAADDRWHVPASDPSVRQSRVAGTPVVETRARVPRGDVVQRAFAVADHGGLTVVEVENDSPLPIAVAFSGRPIISARPTTVAPAGIELPSDARVFPVAHRASMVVALAHRSAGPTALPPSVPPAAQVARGWLGTVERASRLELPDERTVDAVTAARCDILLGDPVDVRADPAGALFAMHERVRMQGPSADDLLGVAEAVELLARGVRHRRRRGRDSEGVDPSEASAALDAAWWVAHRAGDGRALRDLAAVRSRVARHVTAAWLPDPASCEGARLVVATERRLVTDGDLLPAGLPDEWLGRDFAVHGLPAGVGSTLSYAIRWHGPRPAVLWEADGAPVELRATAMAPGWRSSQPSGEALWPAPSGTRRPDPSRSFS